MRDAYLAMASVVIDYADRKGVVQRDMSIENFLFDEEWKNAAILHWHHTSEVEGSVGRICRPMSVLDHTKNQL